MKQRNLKTLCDEAFGVSREAGNVKRKKQTVIPAQAGIQEQNKGLQPLVQREDKNMNLGQIEQLTKEFSEARQQLADRVRALEDEIQTVKRRRLTGIKNTVNTVMEKQSQLKAAIEESSTLFVKPRTMVLHGIKIGFQKAKGKISWSDEDQVIRLIKKHLPDQTDVLIKITEKPIKEWE
jgi:esterase/lipase